MNEVMMSYLQRGRGQREHYERVDNLQGARAVLKVLALYLHNYLMNGVG